MIWLSIAGAVFLIWFILVVLFTPGISYRLSQRTSVHDPGFLYTIQSTCQAALHYGNHVEILTDGPSFYPAMLDAIRSATRSINMELYIFQPGTVADQFISALSERARHGVNVTIVVDAIGSFSLWGRPVRRLRKAGCRIESYQRFQWHSLAPRQQPHPPRAADCRRPDRLRRRRRHCGLVDGGAAEQAPAVARHDGPG